MKSLTIGIAAYNEEASIGPLLDSLLKQKLGRVKLDTIVVCNDVSSDKTAQILARYLSPVKVLTNKKRMGKGPSVDRMISTVRSDILVILDADIEIRDPCCIEKLIQPILKRNVDLTSARVQALPAHSVIGKLLASGMEFKRSLFKEFRQSQSIYTCHGRIRGFSRRLYTRLNFAPYTIEDGYSYLYCMKNGFAYEYVDDTCVYFMLPQRLEDHLKQSQRFIQSMKELNDAFGKEYVTSQYRFTMATVIQAIGRKVRSNRREFFKLLPNFVGYLLVLLISLLHGIVSKVRPHHVYDVSKSSKLTSASQYIQKDGT